MKSLEPSIFIADSAKMFFISVEVSVKVDYSIIKIIGSAVIIPVTNEPTNVTFA